MSSEYTDTFTDDDDVADAVVVVHRLKTSHERRLAALDEKYKELLPQLKVKSLTAPITPPVTSESKYPSRFLTNVKSNPFPLHIPFRVRKELQLQRALLKLQSK